MSNVSKYPSANVQWRDSFLPKKGENIDGVSVSQAPILGASDLEFAFTEGTPLQKLRKSNLFREENILHAASMCLDAFHIDSTAIYSKDFRHFQDKLFENRHEWKGDAMKEQIVSKLVGILKDEVESNLMVEVLANQLIIA